MQVLQSLRGCVSKGPALRVARGGGHVEAVPGAQLPDLSAASLAAQLATFASAATCALRLNTLQRPPLA